AMRLAVSRRSAGSPYPPFHGRPSASMRPTCAPGWRKWSRTRESNPQPQTYDDRALPVELVRLECREPPPAGRERPCAVITTVRCVVSRRCRSRHKGAQLVSCLDQPLGRCPARLEGIGRDPDRCLAVTGHRGDHAQGDAALRVGPLFQPHLSALRSAITPLRVRAETRGMPPSRRPVSKRLICSMASRDSSGFIDFTDEMIASGSAGTDTVLNS